MLMMLDTDNINIIRESGLYNSHIFFVQSGLIIFVQQSNSITAGQILLNHFVQKCVGIVQTRFPYNINVVSV